MSNKINIRHAIIIALGISNDCRDIIDKIHKENEEYYYNIYLNSGFFDDILKGFFSVKTEESINKLIGIVEHCYAVNDFSKIEKIIRAFNPSIINFSKNANMIDMDKFRMKYMLHKIESLSEPEIFTHYMSLLYLGNIYKKNVCGDTAGAFIMGHWDNYLRALTLNSYKYDLKFPENNYEKSIGKLYSVFDMSPFENIKEDKLELFMENFIERQMYKLIDKKCNGLKIDNLSLNEYRDIRDEGFTIGITKYIGSFSRLLDTLGLEKLETFHETPFGNKQMDMILKEFVMAKEGNNLEEKERDLYITACLYIYNLAELYKEAKYLYLNKSKEEKYTELKSLKSEIEEATRINDEKQSKIENSLIEKDEEIRKLKEMLKCSEDVNRELLSQNNKLEKELLGSKNANKDLLLENDMLVEMLKNDSTEIEDDISIDDKINFINSFKLGIFGGNKNIEELSEVLTTTSFYNNLNRDINSIKNMDCVFVNTTYFNHAFSKKVSSVSSKHNIPIRTINGTNLEKIISKIYISLKN